MTDPPIAPAAPVGDGGGESSPAGHRLSPRGVTLLGLVINAVLTVCKVAVGVVFASKTLLADGLHSAADLVTDLAVLTGLRYSARPPDSTHPYGHRRVSTLVAMGGGVGLAVAAIFIAIDALESLHAYLDNHLSANLRPAVPFTVALISVAIKEGLFRVTRQVARRSGDMSLEANAWHHRSDAFSSVAAAAGMGGALIGGEGWLFLDPAFAVVMSALLLLVAMQIMKRSAGELVDQAPGAATMDSITRATAQTTGVVSFHAIRARQTGGMVAVDVHVQVDPALTVSRGHEIAGAVKRSVMAADPHVVEVIVHIEPSTHG